MTKAGEILQILITSEGCPYWHQCLLWNFYLYQSNFMHMVFWVAAADTNCSKWWPSCSFCSIYFTHGLFSHWLHTSRTTMSISHLLQPLEDIIATQLLPALTGNTPFDDYTWLLLALSPKWGGIGLTNPTDLPTLEYLASCKITQPLFWAKLKHFDLSSHDQQLLQKNRMHWFSLISMYIC